MDSLSSRAQFGEWQVDRLLDDSPPPVSGDLDQRVTDDDDDDGDMRVASDAAGRNILRVTSVESVNNAKPKPRLAQYGAAWSSGQRDAPVVRERSRRRPSPCSGPSLAAAQRRQQQTALRAKSASVADVSVGGCLADIDEESSGSVNRLLDDITLLQDRLNSKTAHLSAILDTTSDGVGVSSTKEGVSAKDSVSSVISGRDNISGNEDGDEDEQLAAAIAESYKTARLEVPGIERDDALSMSSHHTRGCCDRKGGPGAMDSATPATTETSSTLRARQGRDCGDVVTRADNRSPVRRLRNTLSNSSLSSSSDQRIVDGRNMLKSPHQRKQNRVGAGALSTLLEQQQQQQQRQKQHRRNHEQVPPSTTACEQYEPHLCPSPQSNRVHVVCCQRHGGLLPYFWRIHRTVDDILIPLTNATDVERAYCNPQIESFTATVGQVGEGMTREDVFVTKCYNLATKKTK
jgi:hypothetical protein